MELLIWGFAGCSVEAPSGEKQLCEQQEILLSALGFKSSQSLEKNCSQEIEQCCWDELPGRRDSLHAV